jgi:hypothetical protein
VLVQVLAGAQAQEEAPRHHGRRRRRRLRDDRRVDAHRGTGHAGAKAQALGSVGDRADHAPDERAVALAVDPGVKVVGDQREGEADLLGAPGVAHQVVGRVFFARKGIA